MELRPAGQLTMSVVQCDGDCRRRRQHAVEAAAGSMAADGIAEVVERRRQQNAPYADLSSDETIRAEELALKIGDWIRDNTDDLVQAIVNGGS